MHFCHVFFPLLLGLVHVTGTFAVDPVNPIPPPARYNLQTKVVGDHKDCGSDKNNLWLYSYHTGAALGDAALSPNKSSAWEAYLNDTRQSFTLGGIHTAPWYLSIIWYNPYTNFDFVEMTVLGRRGEQQGFYFNETGLQRNSSGGQWYGTYSTTFRHN